MRGGGYTGGIKYWGGGGGVEDHILIISRHLIHANTRETSSKTSTFFTKLVITFEVLNQLNWGARI